MTQVSAEVVHISSAIVRAWPDRIAAVIKAIDGLPDVDVFHVESGKIVVVLEGPTSGAVSSRLAEIALIDGVVSANLVYDQVEPLSSLDESIPGRVP
jgi:periplasmic nitrate reductase NapD